ncbi:MAG: permease prefix domain 1-containing protein [Mangrovibacterium sp.]
MERNIKFTLEAQLYNWTERLRRFPEVTESDLEELEYHLLDSIDHLKETGLDEEEAFWVASRRFEINFDVIQDYHTVNNPLIQIRRAVLVFAGVLGFFLVYYFLVCSSMFLFYGLTVSHTAGDIALTWISSYLYGAQVALIICLAGIFFREKKFIMFIRRLRLKPRHTILILIVTFLFALGKQYLYPEIREIGNEQRVWGQLYNVFFYFRFSFPFLFCLSFVFLYWKYTKKLIDPAKGNHQRIINEKEDMNNLSEQINQWCAEQKSNQGGIHTGPEELKSLMLDLINELKALKLSEKEAFGIAVKRLGKGYFQWESKNPEVDDSMIQMKKSFLILAGALAYFLFYYFFGLTSKLFFIILRLFNTDGYEAIRWFSNYLICACLAFVIFNLGVYFQKRKTILFIEGLELKSKHVLTLFLAALVFGIIDICLLALSRNLIMSTDLRISFFRTFMYFDYIFPLIIYFSFIILYVKYYRQIKI